MQSFDFKILLRKIMSANATQILFYEQTRYRIIPWTVQDFSDRLEQARGFLKENKFKQGSKLILCLPNSPWYCILLFVCAVDDYVIIPLDTQSTEEFINKIINETKAEIYIGKDFIEKNPLCTHFTIPDIENFHINQKEGIFNSIKQSLFEIVYTSGSTGEPKGVMLSEENICADIHGVFSMIEIPKNSCLLSLLPLSHMFEQTAGLFVPLYFGAKIFYPYKKDPDSIIFIINNYKITDIVATPAFFTSLKNKLSISYPNVWVRISILKFKTKLRRFVSGGAPLPPLTKLFWVKNGINFWEGYGMTEASPIITFNQTNKIGNGVGIALKDQEIKIAPDGEIRVRGENISKGYFNNAEATKNIIEDGWLATGDIGYLDSKGYLYITGRKKNMLVTQAGVKIFPEDIEKLILQHEHIQDVIVTLDIGEQYLIATIISTNNDLVDKNKIKDKVNMSLNSFQQILKVNSWQGQDFPRLSNGKINRNQCKKILQDTTNRNGTLLFKTSQTTIEEIVAHIVDMEVKEIQDNKKLSYDLHLDSIKRLELISALEQKYNISINESDIRLETTVLDLKKLVKNPKKLKENISTGWQIGILPRIIRFIFQQILFLLLNSFEKISIDSTTQFSKKPMIFTANHSSHLDGPTFLKAISKTNKKIVIIVAKDYFFEKPFLGFLMRLFFNAIPIDRDGAIEKTLYSLGAYIDKGYSILIFPEGTRSTDGKITKFKQGIGFIIKEMQLPVVPIKIKGTYELLPKGAHFPRKGLVTIVVGKLITFSRKDSSVEISESLERIIKVL